MKIFKKFLIIMAGFILISCEKVIEVDLETAEPKLVIDASIDWVKNTPGNVQKIKLSTTPAYYNTECPPVSGADITVSNSSNTVFNFIENPGTGEYICNNFQPVIGETYTLKVTVNGEAYTATEKLINVPNIENNIEQNNEGGMAGDEIEIVYYYHDDGAQENYYLNRVTIPEIAFPQYRVENDENNQGNLTPIFFSDNDLKAGDLVDIRLYGISKRYYDYFKKILSASGNNDNPFSTIPTAVRGNIINQSNSNNFPFGYFRLSEVAVKNYTIQ